MTSSAPADLKLYQCPHLKPEQEAIEFHDEASSCQDETPGVSDWTEQRESEVSQRDQEGSNEKES